jgi:hypothetical protein
MKRLTVIALLLWLGVTWGQQRSPVSTGDGNTPSQTAPTAQAQTEPLQLAPVAALPHAELYAVSFLPLVKGNESVAFVVSPTGKLGTVPMHDIGEAYRSGYRPFTVADLLAITNAVADEERNSQRRIKELSEDYDALAARYNRLAQVNSVPPVQAQPVVNERQLMRAMLFQSLLQRTFPAPAMQIQVQTVDCTKFPALCVGHQ